MHESHKVEVTGWSAGPRWYEETHCSVCGLHVEDENIEAACDEYAGPAE
jgi:hypothetical protein